MPTAVAPSMNPDATATTPGPGPDALTRLAFERTRVAYERTLMAWVRTAASLITFGFRSTSSSRLR